MVHLLLLVNTVFEVLEVLYHLRLFQYDTRSVDKPLLESFDSAFKL